MNRISALREEIPQSCFTPSIGGGYSKKSEAHKKALTRPCLHLDLGLSASRNVENEFPLCITLYTQSAVLCYSS